MVEYILFYAKKEKCPFFSIKVKNGLKFLKNHKKEKDIETKVLTETEFNSVGEKSPFVR